MSTLDDEFADLMQRTDSDERRVSTEDAARMLGRHWRTLEEQRRYGRGPRFIKLRRRILYEVRALKEWHASQVRTADSLFTKEAAEFLGRHPRTLENWRLAWDRAEAEGNPDLRRGPAFHKSGNRVWYERHDLIAYRDSCAGGRRTKTN